MPHPTFTTYLRKKKTALSRMIFWVAEHMLLHRVEKHWRKIIPFVHARARILDVGMGSGVFSMYLKKNKFRVTGVDVSNVSMYPSLQPTIYDGVKLPFTRNQFDVGIITWVLHHCDDPVVVLEEAMRVCKRVVVIENVYNNPFERFLTSVADQISNGEYYDHPYKKSEEWKRIIADHSWKFVEDTEWIDISYGYSFARNYLFVVEK